ncbi:MAG: amylo-alpha-1,6-glucosidase, partial [Deinococcus sp.]|nr:amylo-alpha-1,6-glucosidase [Deinococcus sp.]
GADGIFRHTRARLSPAPTSIEGDGSRCVLVVRRRLKSGESLALTLDVTPGEGELGPFPEANLEAVAESHRRWISDAPRIAAGPADAIVRRAQEDLRALLFPTEDGLYPAAGIPWYVVPFGRDALIIAFQSLPFYPQVAQGVLRHLARHQAKEYDPWRDAAPGKILHELRTGETTRLGLTPHAPYYGSIDATPLFIALLAEYYRWTGDLALIQELESNLQAALGWAAGPGDPDGDGLLEYRRESSRGLDNQGWKDASDSMSHASGQLLAAPIALVEAQGYLYDAYTGAALLYRALGDTRTAQQLESKAQTLRQRFWQHFWSEELGLYALALDYAKQPALVASSNPGHCLWSGMASTQHARRMAERLFAPDLWSGWGIRTLSANAPRYNPMSYHNGSVWPHDNALIAWGLKRYGCDQAANSIVSTLLQAAQTTPDLRLPELFCGFTRLAGTPPVPYPAACVPQGWDAGAVLLFLRTLLGLEVDAAQRLITLRPALPPQLPQLTIEGLPLGSASVTISAWRAGEETRFEVTGDVAVQLARPLV